MNIHFALFFSWIQSQKSEVEMHTSLNGLQEKYKFTFSNFTDSLYIQLSNLSGAGCAKLVFPDCIAGVNRKQSTAQRTASTLLDWLQSWGGQGKDSPWLWWDSKRLWKAVCEDKWNAKTNQVSAIEKEKETLQKRYTAHWALSVHLETREQVAGQQSQTHPPPPPQSNPYKLFFHYLGYMPPWTSGRSTCKTLENSLLAIGIHPALVWKPNSVWARQNLLIFWTLYGSHQSCCSSLPLWPGHSSKQRPWSASVTPEEWLCYIQLEFHRCLA